MTKYLDDHCCPNGQNPKRKKKYFYPTYLLTGKGREREMPGYATKFAIFPLKLANPDNYTDIFCQMLLQYATERENGHKAETKNS